MLLRVESRDFPYFALPMNYLPSPKVLFGLFPCPKGLMASTFPQCLARQNQEQILTRQKFTVVYLQRIVTEKVLLAFYKRICRQETFSLTKPCIPSPPSRTLSKHFHMVISRIKKQR
jgi:hypothetical protein